MKTGLSPLAMIEGERTPATAAEEGVSGDKQSSTAAFDAVLAIVAAQVATISSATKPASVGQVANPTAPANGDAAKDLTKATANTTLATPAAGVWLDGAQAIHLAGLGL